MVNIDDYDVNMDIFAVVALGSLDKWGEGFSNKENLLTNR